MLDIIIKENLDWSDRDILHKILVNQHFIISKIAIFMSDFEDLQALVSRMKGNLDNIKTGVATIVAALPATGGLTADQVATLKAQLMDAAAESDEDAAAVAAALPPAAETPAPDGPGADQPAS